MDSSCLRSITMFTGYFSTVTKKICWFTLKLNRSLKPYHVEISQALAGETGKSMKYSYPVFFGCLDLQWVVAQGKWSGTGGRRKNGGMWVERWKEIGNSTTIINISKG